MLAVFVESRMLQKTVNEINNQLNHLKDHFIITEEDLQRQNRELNKLIQYSIWQKS